MEIVKKNIISITFGIVALALMTAPMWLLNPAQDDIKKNLNDRIAAAKKINALLSKDRQMPVVDENSKPQKLNQFPNQPTIDLAEDLRKKMTQDASNLLQLAEDQNAQDKVLLEKDSLPESRGSTAFNFRDKYMASIRTHHFEEQILHGGPPPSPQDIKDEMDRVYRQQYLTRVVTYPDGKDNRPQIDAEFKKAAVLIPMQLQMQRAAKLSMYVDDKSFLWSSEIGQNANAPTPSQIWNAQVGFWLQQDVCQAIASANQGTRNVSDAVIKRLVSITFDSKQPIPRKTAVNSGAAAMAGAAGGAAEATPETPVADQPLPTNYSGSVTGRVSNGMYDVIPFKLVLHVDAAKLNTVLRKLSNNHFIYIREMQYTPLDMSKIQADRYYYGTSPVVELNLSCEIVYLRSWTTKFMPKDNLNP